MSDPKSDPRRRCMRLSEWPALDRTAWAAAIADGDILSGRGPAAHWRPGTRKSVISAYGRFLTFLERSGWLDRAAGPDARLTPDRLRAYLAELAETIAPVTISSRIRDLAEALRVMLPAAQYSYLNLARRRLKARARPTRNKRARIVPVQQLVDLGFALIDRAETGAFDREIWRACTYRDGVTILLLACRPIRRSNLAAMELGKHLFKTGDSYRLAFDGSETKNHRPYERPLDAGLTPFIDRYLDHYRPLLLGPSASYHVWISWRHVPMSDCNLYGRIRRTYQGGLRSRGLPPSVPRFGDDDPWRAGTGICLARDVLAAPHRPTDDREELQSCARRAGGTGLSGVGTAPTAYNYPETKEKATGQGFRSPGSA